LEARGNAGKTESSGRSRAEIPVAVSTLYGGINLLSAWKVDMRKVLGADVEQLYNKSGVNLALCWRLLPAS
jgi:hypothetical protein